MNQPASARPISAAQTASRSISILGSTGSIGCNTLGVISQHAERFRIDALTAQNNVEKLIEQARTYQPKLAVIGNEEHFRTVKDALADLPIEVAAGSQAVIEAANRPTDMVMAAIVGTAGLRPTLAALRRGATVALANKECLVSAGEVCMQACKAHNATLLPVDSEHNAVFQLFDFEQTDSIERITLTASGGPFRTLPAADFADITPEQAVQHPNWQMGAKISVDSATMMNKGLELIEAYHLFPLTIEQLDIIVHPESIVHSLVHYRDGSVLAQMASPDMRTPIAYALAWPERIDAPTERLDLAAIGSLHFEAPDMQRFPALRLARQALQAGGNAPTILNAANEIAVALFLKKQLRFHQIPALVEATLSKLDTHAITSLEEVLECDALARETAKKEAAALR